MHGHYKNALEEPLGEIDWQCHDRVAYNAMEMGKYEQDFISYIDSCHLQDMVNNRDYYQQNYNEILLNVNFPSQLEQDFFRHVEETERQKNDTKYRQIL